MEQTNTKYHNRKYGFGIHPGIKFTLFVLMNIMAFSTQFVFLRWILLPIEIIIGFIVRLKWHEMRGFFKVLLLNFVRLFCYFTLRKGCVACPIHISELCVYFNRYVHCGFYFCSYDAPRNYYHFRDDPGSENVFCRADGALRFYRC